MKTTFYKKLVPLAMIASLALSGAGSAVAGTGFLTYNNGSIVAFAADGDTTEAPKSTAAVDLNFDLSKTNSIEVNGKFDLFDEGAITRTVNIPISLTENYEESIQDTKKATIYNGETLVGEKDISEYTDKTTKESTWIWQSGTNYYVITYDETTNKYMRAEEAIAGSEAFEALYDVRKDAKKNSTRTLDDIDANGKNASSYSDVKLTDFAFTTDANFGGADETDEKGNVTATHKETIKGIEIEGLKHVTTKQTVTDETGDSKEIDVNDGDKYILSVKVPANVPDEKIYLVYGGILSGVSIDYTKKREGLGKDVGTTVTAGVITKYDGPSTDINFNNAPDVTGIAAGAFKDCKNIKNVILGSKIKTIAANAFEGCDALDTVTVNSNTPIESVGNKAFPDNAVVIIEGGTSYNVIEALEKSNANVFDATQAATKGGKMLISAGDTVKFNCMNNSIISTGADKQTAQLNYVTKTIKGEDGAADTTVTYTFDEVAENDTSKEQITDYKWVVATTAGKGSTAAKIKTNKTYSQLADATKFDITNTKANGKFNNTVVLVAVDKNLKKDYTIENAYAYCTFYIKPAPVTELTVTTKSNLVAGSEDDLNSPIQATNASGSKLWIRKYDAEGSETIYTDSKNDDGTFRGDDYGYSTLTDIDWKSIATDTQLATTDNEKLAWKIDGKSVVSPKYNSETKKVEYAQVDSKTEFDLTITEGQSFALPIKANKEAADKTLTYDAWYGDGDGEGNAVNSFTVVNGKVKGISQGEGDIYVSSVTNPEVYVTIHVNVEANVKKGLTNTSSLTLVGTNEQSFRIGANPISAKDLYYTITEDADLTITNQNAKVVDDDGNEVSTDVEIGTGESKVTYHKLIDGADVITVAQKSGKSIGTAKKSLEIKYYTIEGDAGKEEVKQQIGKSFTVKVNESKTGEYDNVKKFKESAGKLDKTTGRRKLSVPVGVTTYLGLSVTPATANQNFEVNTVDLISGDWDSVNITGDAFTATQAGTYIVRATSEGIDAYGDSVDSSEYEITVYDQGGSIYYWNASSEVNDEDEDTSYDIVGGFLMTSKSAVTDSDHTFAPGKELVFSEPTNGAEEIKWTSSNPAGLAVWVEGGEDYYGGTMHVVGLQPGTYTVTGKSTYTAQKYSFKVIIDKQNTMAEGVDAKAGSAVGLLSGDSFNITDGSNAKAIEKGQTLQLALNVPQGVAGTVKWTTADKTKATVSGKGLVKAVNKENKATDTCVITATMTVNDGNGKKGTTTIEKNFTVNLKSSTVTITPKTVPAAAAAGADFKLSASAKNFKAADIKWMYAKMDGETEVDKKVLTLTNGKAKIDEAGTYKIYAQDDADDSKATQKKYAGTIVISKTAISKLAIVDGSVGEKMSVKDLKNSKVGLQNYAKSNVKDPVRTANVVVKAITDKTDAAADPDDMIWTSSNANAVVASSVKGTTGNAQYATVKVEVVDGTKYTGKVTLTGVSKNGGKKVSFVVYVNDEATGTALGVTSATTKATTAAGTTTTTTTTAKS